MINYSCIKKYREQYPNDICAFSEPGPGVMITSKVNRKSFISPADETEESFLERLKRSIEDNHNYFYDDWAVILRTANEVY